MPIRLSCPSGHSFDALATMAQRAECPKCGLAVAIVPATLASDPQQTTDAVSQAGPCASSAPPTGDEIPGYEILGELGRGGMGVVYLAEHRLLKRRVAIKVVSVDEEIRSSIRHRFYAEMRVLAELSHPNVVFALDAGEVPATGREVTMTETVIYPIENGKIAEKWPDKDALGFL